MDKNKSALQAIVTTDRDMKYLRQHQEIPKFMHYLMSTCLEHQPENVAKFLKTITQQFIPSIPSKDLSKIKDYEVCSIQDENSLGTGKSESGDEKTVGWSNKKVVLRSVQMKEQKRIYMPLVISGCSGVGKNTLIHHLLSQYPQLFQLSVSYTTRPIRNREVQGVDYFFITRLQFDEYLQKDPQSFLEHGEVHGNYYGTSNIQVQRMMQMGKICLLDVDLVAGEKIQKIYPDATYIFIQPPQPYIDTLRDRMIERNQDSMQTIEKRLNNAQKQRQKVKQLGFYEKLVNQNKEKFFRDVKEIIKQNYGCIL